jgi:hypothetical protein
VVSKSISVATHQEWSVGQKMLGDWGSVEPVGGDPVVDAGDGVDRSGEESADRSPTALYRQIPALTASSGAARGEREQRPDVVAAGHYCL